MGSPIDFYGSIDVLKAKYIALSAPVERTFRYKNITLIKEQEHIFLISSSVCTKVFQIKVYLIDAFKFPAVW